ncbi:21280_t:CDS:2, partial [Racocetra persica]
METNKAIDIAVLKNNNDLDLPRLNKYYRSAWRSLELDNSKLDQRCDFLQNKFKNDNSFNESEKTYLLSKLGEYQEKVNLVNKAGKSRRCDDCHNLTYSIQNSVRDAQQNALCSYQIIRGGCATIYKAVWKDSCYDTCSDKDKNNLDWFDEALHHFTIDKIAQYLVPCHRLTKDPNTGNFML